MRYDDDDQIAEQFIRISIFGEFPWVPSRASSSKRNALKFIAGALRCVIPSRAGRIFAVNPFQSWMGGGTDKMKP